MREIKFRAWVRDLQVMIQPEEICFIAFTENGCIVHEFGDPMTAIYEDVEIMQYTGLHDKNGVEIYEGDGGKFESSRYIVRSGNYGDGHVGFHVEWLDGHASKSYRQDLGYWISYGLEFPINIHENPELLGETK